MNTSRTRSAQPVKPSHLTSLELTVGRLQSTLASLHSCIQTLNNSTQDFPRMKHVMQHTRQFEIVTETDIKEAQAHVSGEIQPQMETLLQQADNLMGDLVDQERALESEVEKQDELLRDQQLGRQMETLEQQQQTKAIKGSMENIKKLKRLRMQKDVLRRKLEDINETIKEKEEEIRNIQPQIVKTQKSKPTTNPNAARDTEKAIKAELAELNTKLAERQQAIINKKRSAPATPRKKGGEVDIHLKDGDNAEEARLGVYSKQLKYVRDTFLNTLRGGGLQGSSDLLRDIEFDAERYIEQIENDHIQITSGAIPIHKNWQTVAATQTKALCKLLFPENNIGITMGRILEILIDRQSSSLDSTTFDEAPQGGVAIRELGKEFPPTEERRHHLQKAIRTLCEFGVVETVIEVEEAEGQIGNSQNIVEGELILRIKFFGNE